MGRVLILGKRDEQAEQDAQEWIEAILQEKWPEDAKFENVLKDGQVLCRLMNRLSPGSVRKIHTSGSSFKLMENVAHFLEAIVRYGVPEGDVFQTPDLFEKKDTAGVCNTIFALGRQTYNHPEWPGPWLGPKPGEA